MRLISGVDRADHRTVEVNGTAIAPTPRARINAGLGLVPEELKRDGIIRHRPVTSNTALPAMRSFSRAALIRKTALKARTEALMREVNLRPLDVLRPIGSFSGATSKRPSSVAGWRRAPRYSCSRSPPPASTSVPRPRFTI